MELRKEYDAVYIAIGAHIDRKIGIEGEDAGGVISAVELLRGIGDDEMPDFTGKDIVVIGGGNVAMGRGPFGSPPWREAAAHCLQARGPWI